MRIGHGSAFLSLFRPGPDSEAMAVIVISGGTDGMGRALALGRAARGDRVFAIGSNPAKGARLGEGSSSCTPT